jgi:hypothetical protein
MERIVKEEFKSFWSDRFIMADPEYSERWISSQGFRAELEEISGA